MKTRLLLAAGLLACLPPSARATFNITWGGSGTNIASNTSYSVTVNCYFAPNNYGDPQGMLSFYKNGAQVGAASMSPYSWGSSSGTFSDTGPQTISFTANAFSYYGETGYSSYAVTISPQSIATTFSLSGGPFTYDGSTKSVSLVSNPGNATYNYAGTFSAVNAGTYWVYGSGYGNYTGTANLYWTIAPAGQSSVGISPGSATVTVGQAVTFNASGGGGGGAYVWGNDASGSGSAKTVTFNTPGTRYVSVYRQGDSNYNQSNTATATITVNANQGTVGVSPAAQTITVGSTLTFTASGGGGSGAYVWGGDASGSGPTASVTFNTVGTRTVTVYRAASSGYNQSNTATATITVQNAGQGTVTVSPASAAITVGQSVSFTASGGSGSGAYTWGGDASGTGPTQSVTFNTAGSRSVTVYRAASSGYNQSNTATSTITVNANQGAVSVSPAAASTGINQSLTFTASGGGGTGDYVWGGDATGTGPTKSVTFNTAGSRTVTVYRAASAGYNQSATAAATIAVDGTPPGAPQNLRATGITTTSLTLAWDAPAGEAVTGYRVREPGVSVSWIPISGLSLQFGGFGANSGHTFEVQAQDQAGNWSVSASLTATTGGATGGPGVAGNTFWADVNNDGILDQVTGSNADNFSFSIGSWYTTAPAVGLNLNSYFSAWNGNYEGANYNGFFLAWAPPVTLWASGEWLVNLDFRIVTEADRPLKIYKDPSGLPDIDPARWQLVINLPGFTTAGTHYVTHVLNHMTAGGFTNKQLFLVSFGQPVGSIEISSSSGTVLGTANPISGGATITLPAGSNMRIAAKDLVGQILNAANNKVVFSVKDVLGQLVSLPNNGLLDILDIGVSVSGTWQVGVKIGDGQTIWFSINVQGPPPPPKVLLLLHGMNSNTAVWQDLVDLTFNGSATEIRDGAFQGAAPIPNSSGVFCYRLQFGSFDMASPRAGVEGITAANTTGYNAVGVKCGDFETFEQLGQEVEEAITLVHLRHPLARIVLLGHSRGGISARAFLQRTPPVSYPAPPPNVAKAAVAGLLTTSSPHLGSRMGRIYGWLQSHPRGQPGTNAADWNVVDFLNCPVVLFGVTYPSPITVYFSLGAKPSIDVRRPVIGDVADNSLAIFSLNTLAAVQELPAHIIYGEIVYDRVPLGSMSLGPNYSVFEIQQFPFFQLSEDAEAFVVGSGNTPDSMHGDGLIPAANQRFTQLPGFSGASILPWTVTSRDVVHTDAPHETSDIMFRLRAMVPAWFP